ncbi:DUF6893 family small protein [Nocardia asiatica]|uniref:DUF6893 family small protein n=1 Tax=Nocardia asiatica TaxID=209252 RepID=UPI003EE0D8D2
MRTSGSCSTTTPRPNCTNGTAATCISRPTNWSRSTAPRSERKSAMETVGVVSTTVVAVLVAAGLYLGVRSIPDLRRYLKIRHM